MPIRLFASAIEHPTKTNKIDAAVSVEDPATTNPRVTPKKKRKIPSISRTFLPWPAGKENTNPGSQPPSYLELEHHLAMQTVLKYLDKKPARLEKQLSDQIETRGGVDWPSHF